jgi:hypothetical protein
MMNRGKTCIGLGLVMGCLALLTTVSMASEPKRTEFDRALDRNKENAIQYTSNLSATEVFERLKDVDYIADEYYMKKTIYKSFQHREINGIDLSLQKLSLPEKEFTNGKAIHRSMDLYVVKRILESFPETSIPKLLKLYESGDAVTKGNVLRVSGKLEGPAVDGLLINALSDKTVCDQQDPEADGPPMRLCDLAYNQLVMRFQVMNVLRTIGPVHMIENRDYHIAVLKGRL